MKYIIIAVLAITLFGCTKEAKEKSMTVAELKAGYGIDLIAAWDVQFAGVVARGSTPKIKRPVKTDVVNLIDGSIQFDGTTFTTSDNPKFAGVNNQTTVVSICNYFFSEGGTAQTLTCNNSTGSGQIMAWNTDWDDNVYRSELVNIP